ncbi:MAG TPA: TolC family protein [Chitinophagaceae bacterium]|nr:TolC family protein [Chitinophagaceae bacterium]
MNRCIKLAICLLLYTAATAQSNEPQPGEKWDLQKCVDYALANNISIKQQDVQARIAALTYKQSFSSQFPSLNFGTNLGLNTGRSIDRTTNQFTTESILYNSFSLQANVDVFNWFSKKNTIAGDRLETEASKASVEKLKNDISLNVAAAYLQVLLAKEQINVSKVQISQTDSQLYNTRIQVQVGSLPELNVAELEAQLAADSSSLISAIGTERQSILLLQSLLNLDAGKPFDVTAPPVELIPIDPIAELQPEPVYELALKNLPQQQVNKLRLEAARKYQQAAKGSMYPSVSVGASLGTNYSTIKNNQKLLSALPIGVDTIAAVSGSNTPVVVPKFDYNYRIYASPYGTQISDNFSNSVGLSISVPIFNGRSARTNWEKQKLNVTNLALQPDLDNMTLKQDIYKAYTDAITSIQKFNATTKSVSASQQAYDFAQKRYDVGLLNTIDLLTNQNNLFRAKIERLSAQFDYVFKMKVLEFYRGQGLKL